MTGKPAVLLISPGILKWTDMDFGLPHMVSMGGWLQAHTDVRVELLDLNYEGGDHHQLKATMEELGPFVLIGLSCYSSFDYRRVMALAAFLKQAFPDVPLVTGGYHASALPEDLVFAGSPFDAVALGEGERPLQRMVEEILGDGRLQAQRYGPDLIEDLDTLPPTDWSLLRRYWPRAHTLGRKFQLYLSRGCPYRCTFCMERSKSGYSWRAFSPERAIEEVAGLARMTDLSRWVVNIADPLFGYHRRWRREVLQGIVDRGLLPRAFWTLTRSDDLDEPDFELLSAARFSIGIGLESGSPRMLQWMQKGNTPERYLAAVTRLADRSQAHGLTWAVNVIVGHPGETPETLAETGDFVKGLFARHERTRGWLSIDPFRLYPGSAVAEQRADWEARFGARFYAPRWWTGWYDLGFHAQHLDPSRELSYEERLRSMHQTYAPVVADIAARFQGQGRDIDRVYEASLQGQVSQLTEDNLRHHLTMGERARSAPTPERAMSTLRVPLGLRMKDPWVRHREQAIRRLLDRGVLRSEPLVEALLAEGPEAWMPEDAARAVLDGRHPPVAVEGLPPLALGMDTVAMGLEALEPDAGMVVAELAAGSPWLAAILARLVGKEGRVLLTHLPEEALRFGRLPPGVSARARPLSSLLTLPEAVDRLWLGVGLPRFPAHLGSALRPGARSVALLGPRFRPQDLVLLTQGEDEALVEHRISRTRAPVLGGPQGWLRQLSRPAGEGSAGIRLERRLAPALAYHLLSQLDLGADAASLYCYQDKPAADWAHALRDAYLSAPGRLTVHAHPLAYDRPEAWLDALERSPPEALRDPAGRALVSALVLAARAELPAWSEGFTSESPGMIRARERLLPALSRLRERMWQQQGGPPPLLLLDCPALGRHGRATLVGGTRVIAVSLDEPDGHVICQVLHEDMHAITDPIVRAEQAAAFAGSTRDTRQGSPGFALHQALESVAVGATAAFLQARAPELMHDFEIWQARVGG